MVNKQDLILMLTEMQEDGINVDEQLQKVFLSTDLPIDVIKFINNKRELDISKFYTHLRKSYNQKKSKLYINIMKDIDDPTDVLTTLASLNLQILLFSKNATDKQLFLSHSRCSDIVKVL